MIKLPKHHKTSNGGVVFPSTDICKQDKKNDKNEKIIKEKCGYTVAG